VTTQETDEIECLLQQLKDDRRDVRSKAAYELGKHPDPRTLEPLVAALCDNDKFVRSWAAGALGKAGSSAIDPLLRVLEMPDASVCYYAALALAELGDMRAIPTLSRALREGDWDIRPSAAQALAGFGDPESLPDRVLVDERLSPGERVTILEALKYVAYTDDDHQLHYALESVPEFCKERAQAGDEHVRRCAAETIQILENESANAEAGHSDEPITQPAPEPAIEHEQPISSAAAASGTTPDRPKRSLWDRLTGR